MNDRPPNVILVGLSGSGKSSVGRALSHYLGYGFFSADDEIEKQQKESISDIITKNGEPAFRMLETQLYRDCVNLRHVVIATGAGALDRPENLDLLLRLGKIVWLKSSIGEIVDRLLAKPSEITKRPLLRQNAGDLKDKSSLRPSLITKLQEMSEKRSPLYMKADITFDSAFMTVDQTASALAQFFRRPIVKEPSAHEH